MVQSAKPTSAEGDYMCVDWTAELRADALTLLVYRFSFWAGKKDLVVADIAEPISRVKNELLKSWMSVDVFIYFDI